MIFLRFAAVLMSILLIFAGCTPLSVKKNVSTMIAPNKGYEECFELRPGQVLEYSFNTSKPVDYNIHYHAEDDVHYPVSEKNVSTASGELKVEDLEYYTEEQEFFCLMWESNNNEYLSLECDYMIKDRK
ncbi:MAG TPA: hypothetical protein ENH40_02105 [Nitrospirae bacterium]|nr:hypothetical protein [Nitrospirota bacterium]